MVDKRFFTSNGPITLGQILEVTKAYTLKNLDNNLLFYDIAALNVAGEGDISIFHNSKYIKDLAITKAGACFISKKYVDYANQDTILLISDNPYKSYAIVANLFYSEEKNFSKISEKAIIDDKAIIGKNCYIGANSVIEAEAKIGDNTVIGVGSYIGKNVVIGNNCNIHNNVSITHSIIGNGVTVHSNAVIGKPGFGFASDMSGHYHVPHLGRVIIGNNCSIGANSCIDRGSNNDTVISDYCMIDNLVQIGHNVQLGKACVIVAMVGIAGSTKLGDYVLVGGQVGIAGHLNIGSYSQIAAGSGVIKDIESKKIYGGYPAIPIKDWHRQSIILKKLTSKDGDKDE